VSRCPAMEACTWWRGFLTWLYFFLSFRVPSESLLDYVVISLLFQGSLYKFYLLTIYWMHLRVLQGPSPFKKNDTQTISCQYHNHKHTSTRVPYVKSLLTRLCVRLERK
jgi:hypothetical protein